jgi:hypothetical protein
MKRKIKKNKNKKKLGRMVALQMDKKRLGPLEKPLRMTDKVYIINMHTCNTKKSLKYKRRRIRRRRIAPNRRIRRD